MNLITTSYVISVFPVVSDLFRVIFVYKVPISIHNIKNFKI